MNDLASASPRKHTMQWTQISGKQRVTQSSSVGHKSQKDIGWLHWDDAARQRGIACPGKR